jgi:uncharacterized protein YecT (DUF1311 family)
MKTTIVTLALFITTSIGTLHASQAGKELNDADSQLNKVYKQLLISIDDSSQKALLVTSQREWLQYRDETIAFFTARYPYSKGGLFLNIHLIKDRTTFLQSLLETSPQSDPEGIKPSGYVALKRARASGTGSKVGQ